MEYAKFKINKILSSLVGKSKDTDELKKTLSNTIEELEPKSFYDEHINLLNEICDKKDYEKGLKHYNNKGMMSFVGGKIIKEYKDRVIDFIKENETLQQIIKDKYFKDIPND